MSTCPTTRPRFAWWIACAWLAFLALLAGQATLAPPLWAVDSFETPTASWTLRDHDGPIRLLRHQRVFDEAHSGAGSEFIEFEAGRGTYFHITHSIAPSLLHPELMLGVWVKAEQAGVQVLLRVVLPHAKDPQSGQPMTILVSGDSYALAGQWQHLTLKSLPTKLQRQLRALRAESHQALDDREAYADMVVVNAFQGPRLNRLWLDDLEVQGRVESRTQAISQAIAAQQIKVEIRGDALLVNGTPQFLRMARYRGEPLETLRALGFNTVYTDLPASRELLAEALTSRLWVVAAPPPRSQAQLGAGVGQLIAWTTGPLHQQSQFASVPSLAAHARNLSPSDRPVAGDFRRIDSQAAKAADILLLGEATRNSSISLRHYQQWLNDCGHEGRVRSPRWGRIELDPSPSWQQQLELLGLDTADRLLPSWQQLRAEALMVLSSGVRGILVDTRRPLTAINSSPRAALVKLLNDELSLLGPWFAGGERTQIYHPDKSTDVTQFATQRSRLLVAQRRQEDSAFVDAVATNKQLSMVAPPLSGSSRGFRVTRGSLESLYSRRVPGGDHVMINEAEDIELIVLSHDPLVLNHLARSLNEDLAGRSARLDIIARNQLGLTAETGRRLSDSSRPDEQQLESARSELQKAQTMASEGKHLEAFRVTRTVLRELATLRHSAWQLEVAARNPLTSPALMSFPTLPLHGVLRSRTADGRWSGNLLGAANLEDLESVQRAGWINRQANAANWHTDVSFISAAHDGRSCLRMACTTTSVKPRRPADALVTVHSAPVRLHAGQIVRVSGWIKTPFPLKSLDGLLIYDNIGGRDLGIRFHRAAEWTRFDWVRTAPVTGPFVITWELTDAGEAWIDEVSVSVHAGRSIPGPVEQQAIRGYAPR